MKTDCVKSIKRLYYVINCFKSYLYSTRCSVKYNALILRKKELKPYFILYFHQCLSVVRRPSNIFSSFLLKDLSKSKFT